MGFANLLALSYWFAIYTPPFRQPSFVAALIVLGMLFAAGVVLKVLAKRKKINPPLARGLSRLAKPLFFISISGFILAWVRQLGAGILSARFWFALIFLITVAWFALVLRSVLRKYKIEYTQMKERWKYEKYLPKKRGK